MLDAVEMSLIAIYSLFCVTLDALERFQKQIKRNLCDSFVQHQTEWKTLRNQQ